jgi:hypothetical protein
MHNVRQIININGGKIYCGSGGADKESGKATARREHSKIQRGSIEEEE